VLPRSRCAINVRKKTVARNIAKNLAIANRSRSASYISPSEFRSNLTVKIIVHLQKFFFQQVLNWSNINDMTFNFTKTKEMVMGPVALSSNLPFIQWAEGQIERVSSFKLLGLHL